jgi:hypothetical protein
MRSGAVASTHAREPAVSWGELPVAQCSSGCRSATRRARALWHDQHVVQLEVGISAQALGWPETDAVHKTFEHTASAQSPSWDRQRGLLATRRELLYE